METAAAPPLGEFLGGIRQCDNELVDVRVSCALAAFVTGIVLAAASLIWLRSVKKTRSVITPALFGKQHGTICLARGCSAKPSVAKVESPFLPFFLSQRRVHPDAGKLDELVAQLGVSARPASLTHSRA
jgi:hypothetical protein